jgi:outer membrane protein insertion porin family
LLFTVVAISSCNVTRSLQEGESLLVKNKIVIEEDIPKKRFFKESLALLPPQKPNKKMFGIIPIRLALYAQANSKKENKFRWWLKNKVGEAPVVFKNESVDRAKIALSNYMFNRGYLHNEVVADIQENNKKIKVVYSIIPKDRYYISEVVFPEPDNLLNRTILLTEETSLLAKGDPFDVTVMDNERKRISDFMRDAGYFYFNKEYLAFDLDSNQVDKTIKLIMVVKDARNPNDFKKFRINNIYTYTNYKIDAGKQTGKLDTVVVDEYHFIADEFKFKSKTLINAIHFSKGEYFKMTDHQKTIRKFGSYGTFKFTDVEFKDLTASKGNNDLDVYIYLTPSKKQSMSVEIEANHSFQGFTGSALSYIYKNKNLSKGADMLEFRVSTGVEFEFRNQLSMLRNADVIGEVNYYLNKFLVPFPLKNVSKNNNVRTRFSLRYNFGRRIPFYTLHSNTFTFGYEWNETSNKRHIYNPIAINLLLIPKKEDAFVERLINTPSLARSFEEVIVAGSNYTYLLSTRKSDKDRSYFFFRGDVRMSGNLVHAMSMLANINKDNEKPYKIGNVTYSQFFRLEGDVVHYFKFAPHATLVNRFNSGVIYSYGNTTTAPYFQQFYAGGPNSIRGFRLRALGPGTYADLANIDNPNFFFDQAGDIKMETNAELRFDIYKWFKGALFLDAGNVWLIRKEDDRPEGEFKFNNFHKAIAIGTGFGLRLDFDYFVIRTDIGIPIRDPRLTSANEQWVIKNFNLTDRNWRRQNLIFNLAIGYPF